VLKKPYLQSPVRERVVTFHRQLISKVAAVSKRLAYFLPLQFLRAYLRRKFTRSEIAATQLKEKNMKPNSLLEMIFLQFRWYKGRYIDLTVVDDTELKPGWNQLVVADDDGDVTRLFMFIMDESPTQSFERKLEFGWRVRLSNTYFEIASSERRTGIMFVEPKCIEFMKGVENMCRFYVRAESDECKCSNWTKWEGILLKGLFGVGWD